MPGQLPRVQVDNYGAFYLAPNSAVGAEAIVYLQSYNEAVRQERQRSGFELISEARGDFSESGENRLVILPPTDETIRRVVAVLQSRVADHDARLKDEIGALQEQLKDNLLDSSDRKLFGLRLRQMKAVRAHLASDQPTFSQLKSFFYREHRMRLAAGVPGEFRQHMERIMEEKTWSDLQAAVDADAEAEAATA